ncbi:TetR/AcrR family transcriptional regulator [Streptomyces flavofungini]|uniref:TetR/AcrR family transcriptional regulator n=1 Tax=Streptomyces flavofungini TaxID=68200 RepID=A0ABS0WYN5_9ACTN|nr:TetR/AcrR family transcriptional regulator [Streptomyces flavofungini]MBJ3806053.1 TetR/AcrR family transcriptional regulator [Streptomyces flavofungini]GHC76708.1 TetR family transcriptional regulator [Streptomyces flavofungini]
MAKAADRPKRAVHTSVWLEGKAPRGTGRRGDQPAGLDRDRITEATVRLLDAEGLAKFSMRRLAAELNVTAMSVYWYVDTKDDLLELALDRVAAEVRLPDTETVPGEWREQLRELAAEYRQLLIRHPWVSPLIGEFLNIGPNWLEVSLAIQRAVRNTGLTPYRQNGAIAAVFQFVYGFGTIEGHFLARVEAAGMTQDEYFRGAVGSVNEELATNPAVRSAKELMESRSEGTVPEMWARDFTIALDLMIAGIESLLDPAVLAGDGDDAQGAPAGVTEEGSPR